MRLTCPACGATSSLDALIGHEAARTSLVLALDQTPVGKRLIRYLALFRPAQRQLSWDRTANLLGELLDLIGAARIERHGRVWAAPADTWIVAIDEILARRDEGKLTLPLKSHGYLLEIIAGQAGKIEAAAENRKEAGARGVTPVGAHAPAIVISRPRKRRRNPARKAQKRGWRRLSRHLNRREKSMTKSDLLVYILTRHIGRANGITAAALAQTAGLEEREVRNKISHLREDGHAICAHPNSGYFIAANAEELEETCQFLRGRALHSLRLESRLRNIPMADLIGQMKLRT